MHNGRIARSKRRLLALQPVQRVPGRGPAAVEVVAVVGFVAAPQPARHSRLATRRSYCSLGLAVDSSFAAWGFQT